ncbi:hypothetical protein [Xanthomonas massiliensis]|uniref:hypothetical protein n=1 Tax=Xanthomonas massiliensis TaxID=1720302 RepID=UPI0011CA01B4|nr:hypothetical protein [Xanthomonas massiliensis]
MNKKRLAIARMIVVVALCSLAFGCGSRKVMPMDRTGWKTHCIGRFLVELPTNAEVSSIYKIWGDEFRWMSDDPVHLQKMVIERRAELERIRRGEGSSFVEMVNHEGGGVTLLSWDVELPDSDDFMWMDSYFVGHPAGRVFNYSGGFSAKKGLLLWILQVIYQGALLPRRTVKRLRLPVTASIRV